MNNKMSSSLHDISFRSGINSLFSPHFFYLHPAKNIIEILVFRVKRERLNEMIKLSYVPVDTLLDKKTKTSLI